MKITVEELLGQTLRHKAAGLRTRIVMVRSVSPLTLEVEPSWGVALSGESLKGWMLETPLEHLTVENP